jgi:hypothetical protein
VLLSSLLAAACKGADAIRVRFGVVRIFCRPYAKATMLIDQFF